MSSKKANFLKLEEKGDILEALRTGTTVTSLAKQYNVAKSTISGIKKKEEAITKCISNTYSGPGKRKTMRASKLPKMEECLYQWFIQMRNNNCPVSGVMLRDKAKQLHSQIKESDSEFTASDGWLQRFKRRYGVPQVYLLSAEWNEGWNDDPFADVPSEIHKVELEEQTDFEDVIPTIEVAVNKIDANEAVEVFDKALEWAGQECIDQVDVNVLRRLREKAIFQTLENKRKQKKITDFFKFKN